MRRLIFAAVKGEPRVGDLTTAIRGKNLTFDLQPTAEELGKTDQGRADVLARKPTSKKPVVRP